MNIQIKEGQKVDRSAIERMEKQKNERYFTIQSKETGKIMRAKESYAKQLLRENKIKILSN